MVMGLHQLLKLLQADSKRQNQHLLLLLLDIHLEGGIKSLNVRMSLILILQSQQTLPYMQNGPLLLIPYPSIIMAVQVQWPLKHLLIIKHKH